MPRQALDVAALSDTDPEELLSLNGMFALFELKFLLNNRPSANG